MSGCIGRIIGFIIFWIIVSALFILAIHIGFWVIMIVLGGILAVLRNIFR